MFCIKPRIADERGKSWIARVTHLDESGEQRSIRRSFPTKSQANIVRARQTMLAVAFVEAVDAGAVNRNDVILIEQPVASRFEASTFLRIRTLTRRVTHSCTCCGLRFEKAYSSVSPCGAFSTPNSRAKLAAEGGLSRNLSAIWRRAAK